MERINISALVFCEDPGLRSDVIEQLKPLVRSAIPVASQSEAIAKASNQDFELVIYRTAQAGLKDPKGFFEWSLMRRNGKGAAWIVLGKDIENPEALLEKAEVKFLEDYKNKEALSQLIGTLFYRSPADGKSAPPLDVNFINPIVKAVVEVTASMGQVELSRGTPFLKKPTDAATAQGDISGIIAMNSNRFIGSLALCFEEQVILEIYKNMLGTAAPSLNDEVKDAVAELTNIIFGNAKRDLNILGHTIAPAIPSVVTGKNHEIRHSVKGFCICIPFESKKGKIVVEYVIATNN